MKHEEFGIKTLFAALKHQWKFILVVVLVFALVGVGAAAAFSDQGVSEAGGEAEALPAVDYSNIKMNFNYYDACRKHLLANHATAVAYQKDFVGKNSLTTQQKDEMAQILVELKNYSDNVLSLIDRKFSIVGAVYIPAAFYDSYTEMCEENLGINRHKLEVAETAAELLAAMDVPTTTTESIEKDYALILSTAASALEHMPLVQIYEARLVTLQDKEAVQAAEVEIKQMLDDAAEELNALIATLNEKANAIAKENHVIFNVVPATDATAQFTLRHTHNASSAQESFVLIVLFCVLTGICAGIFFAVYRECKRQKKSQAN